MTNETTKWLLFNISGGGPRGYLPLRRKKNIKNRPRKWKAAGSKDLLPHVWQSEDVRIDKSVIGGLAEYAG